MVFLHILLTFIGDIMKWEYMSDTPYTGDTEALIKRLNILGEEGWNLVTISSDNLYIFKRVKT